MSEPVAKSKRKGTAVGKEVSASASDDKKKSDGPSEAVLKRRAEDEADAAMMEAVEAEAAAVAEAPAAKIVGAILDNVASISHIILGMLYAYAVGRLGFHVSWVIFSMFLVWRWSKRYAETAWVRRFHALKRADARKHTIAAEKESTVWLNTILEKFFPVYSPQISDAVEASVIKALDDALKEPPPGVAHISVAECSLGRIPPTLSNIKTFRPADVPPTYKYQMDATLTYRGDVTIVLVIGVGSKLASLDVPVAVNNISLEGRVRIGISMRDKLPLLKTMTVCFKKAPKLGFELEPGRAFDLTQTPGLEGYLDSVIADTLSSILVYPNKIPVELGEAVPEGWVDPEHALVEDDHIGVLRLTVVGASGLRAVDRSLTGARSSDPFCLVVCGAETYRSATLKKTLEPKWNYTCDVLVDRRRERQQLTLSVYDEDMIGKNDLLGAAQLNFAHVVKEDEDSDMVEKSLPLQGVQAQGQVEVKYCFITD